MFKWTESVNGGVNNLYVVQENGETASSKISFKQAEMNLYKKLNKMESDNK